MIDTANDLGLGGARGAGVLVTEVEASPRGVLLLLVLVMREIDESGGKECGVKELRGKSTRMWVLNIRLSGINPPAEIKT